MNTVKRQSEYRFSTRDILMMAVLAALGGFSSTLINTVGDTMQAMLGFAGTTQWAAGLHVLWLVLAVGITGKPGSGIITGLLKGAVEFLSGNTHGILVLLINLVAGILVDLGMLPFRRTDSLPALGLAGGLASASNVIVFQLFASTPEEVLKYVWAIAGVAFVSGVVLAGLLGHGLLQALRRAGVAKQHPVDASLGVLRAAFLVFMIGLAIGMGIYIRSTLQGPPQVAIMGAVAAPYDYHPNEVGLTPRTIEIQSRGMTRPYTGAPLADVLALAQPSADAASVLIRATDGYSFFISMAEIQRNEQLFLAHHREGDEISYEIVGAENAKAWVRGVAEIQVVPSAIIQVGGPLGDPTDYDPNDWQFEMDNARLDLGAGEAKYQGTALRALLEAWEPAPTTSELVFRDSAGNEAALSIADALADDGWRIWTVNAQEGMTFAVANANGQVLLTDVTEIEIR